MTDRIGDRLADEYASGLPRSVADCVFALAWEHGHACGESDIENYYIDFAGLATAAYHAGRVAPAGSGAQDD